MFKVQVHKIRVYLVKMNGSKTGQFLTEACFLEMDTMVWFHPFQILDFSAFIYDKKCWS